MLSCHLVLIQIDALGHGTPCINFKVLFEIDWVNNRLSRNVEIPPEKFNAAPFSCIAYAIALKLRDLNQG